jgi:hypothetical protein
VRILAVPAATPVMGEEAPREPVVLVLHEDAHAPSVARPLAYVLLRVTYRNSGPVEYMTFMYGRTRWGSCCCSLRSYGERMGVAVRNPLRHWRYRWDRYGVPRRDKPGENPGDGCSPITWRQKRNTMSIGGILTSSRSMYVPPKCARIKYRIESAH